MYILILCNPSEVEHWDITSDNRNERENPQIHLQSDVFNEWDDSHMWMDIREVVDAHQTGKNKIR